MIGYGSNVNNGALTNATAIGQGAIVDASNKMVLGNGSVNLVQTTGRLYTSNGTDATTTSTGALQVTGGAGIGLQLRVGGATTLTGAAQINNTLGVTGITSITNTTDASSVSTGSLVLSGGLGVASQLRVGGNVTFGSSSILNVTNTTASSATNNGALIVGGGVGIGGKLYVGSDMSVGGTMVVSGQTTFSSGNVYGVTATTNESSTRFATTAYVMNTLASAANGASWGTAGNTGMTDYAFSLGQSISESSAGKFIGNTDGYPLNFRVANVRSGRIDNNLNVGQTSFGYGAGQNAWLENNSGNGYRGTKNTAIGFGANYNTNVGKENTSLGYYSMYNNQASSGSVSLGYQSLMNYSNNYNGATPFYVYNTAVGYQSLMGPAGSISSNQSSYNTALGYQTLYNTVSGSNNVAIGAQALFSNNNGYYNNAIGYQTLYLLSSGQYNEAHGYQALYSVTSGSSNIGLGGYAGNSVTTGSNNTLIGYDADVTGAALNNATAIGYGASVAASNTVRIGNTAITSIGGQVAWTAASDVRIKKNVVNSKYGLETVMQLRPVEYNLISNDLRQVGFIAQEVQKLVPEVVTGKEGDISKGEVLGITYSNLVPVLAKSIQELNTLNTITQADLNTKLSYTSPSQLTLGNANVKEVVTNANVTVGESLSVKHLKGNSSTPSIETAIGSGNNAVVKITGTDMSGVIEVTTGDTPTANAILATIQYSSAYGTAPVVIITPGNAATASLMGTSTVFVGNITNTNFTLNSNATPLVTKTTYKWYYQVIQ